MTALTLPTVAERVAAGAELLDQRLPGWDTLIDLGRLDLGSGCLCILGQLEPEIVTGEENRYSDPYYRVASTWHLSQRDAAGYGFYELPPTHDPRRYAELTTQWRRLIETRRAER